MRITARRSWSGAAELARATGSRSMINPYESPQSESSLAPSVRSSVDRDRCPICNDRNNLGEMLWTRDSRCRGCGSELAVLLDPGLNRMVLGGFIVLFVLTVWFRFVGHTSFPWVIPLLCAWSAMSHWISHRYGRVGIGKATWISRLLERGLGRNR